MEKTPYAAALWKMTHAPRTLTPGDIAAISARDPWLAIAAVRLARAPDKGLGRPPVRILPDSHKSRPVRMLPDRRKGLERPHTSGGTHRAYSFLHIKAVDPEQ